MEYLETAQRFDLLPEEVELLRELFNSPGYRLLRKMEQQIKKAAMQDIEFSDDPNVIRKAQGKLAAFRLRDGYLKDLYNSSEKEKEEGDEA